MTGGAVRNATMRMGVPQRGQRSGSTSKMRRSSSAWRRLPRVRLAYQLIAETVDEPAARAWATRFLESFTPSGVVRI